MMNNNLVYMWLVLDQLPSLKPQDWLQLCKTHNLKLSELAHLTSDDWLSFGISKKVIQKRKYAEQAALRALEHLALHPDIKCIHFGDKEYPKQLLVLSHPPCVLFVKGNSLNLNKPQFAIVGSRHATENGKRTTQRLANELADVGLVITSGLARGIDSSAHWGALASNNGSTLAVLGSGVDVCYPKQNQNLYTEILNSGGTILSEFIPGTPPRAHHFPCRNRIVAALSEGVMVIEAKIRSGSLITSNLAADLGKDVFAVPGNINHPLSEGVNWLIQQGAKLVTRSTDILDELNICSAAEDCTRSEKKGLEIEPILDSVNYDVTNLSDITKHSKQSSSEVLTALLDYELQGLVTAVPGGYVKLRGK